MDIAKDIIPDSTPAAGDSTILVVDDQIENLELLAHVLQPYFRVRAARSGEQALRAINSDPIPDLILLDIMMPGMDGYEVCRILKSDPLNAYIPVIFLTAMVEDEDALLGFEMGAVDYITKPFNPAILLARVKTHLRLGRHEKLLFRQANIDLLTLLPNRDCFDNTLAYEWRRAVKNQSPLALILAEMDFLRDLPLQLSIVDANITDDHVNLTEKNDILRQIALLLEEIAEQGRFAVFRYNVEKFAVVLPDTDTAGAIEIARQLRAKVAAEAIPRPLSTSHDCITMSYGVASLLPHNEQKVKELVESAEQQLALALLNGRDRIYPLT